MVLVFCCVSASQLCYRFIVMHVFSEHCHLSFFFSSEMLGVIFLAATNVSKRRLSAIPIVQKVVQELW